MAGTDRIDVMFLHQLQISQKLFPCDCSSGKRIAVVAVGTFDLEVHTVDIDDISFDIDPAKADFLSNHFIRCGKNQRIQCRMFCIPQIRIIYGKPHFPLEGVAAARKSPSGAYSFTVTEGEPQSSRSTRISALVRSSLTGVWTK